MTSEAGLSSKQVRNLLLATQLVFFTTLVVCVLINHSTIAKNDGISFYGVYYKTVELLVFGFVVSVIGLWRTSTYFATTDAPRITVVGLRVVAVGLLGLLATPYNRGTFFNWTHMSIGVAMALVQLAMSLRLLLSARTPRTVAGFALQLAGGLMAAASLPDWHFNYLGPGETIFEIGFSWCLVEWTYALYARLGQPRTAR
jgi:hypothetical protein